MVLTQLTVSFSFAMYVLMFPYHYGSHATVTERFFRKQWYRFPYHYGSHATGTGRDSRGTDGNVSIPLWFSRNKVLKKMDSILSDLVSIPLWFSRNLQRFY